MISPRTGRPIRAHHGARVAVVFALAFGLIATPHLALPTAANAAADDSAQESTVALSLRAGVHGVVQPGAPVTVVASVQNDDDQDLTAGRITVELNRTPLASPEALNAWLDTGEAAGGFTPLGTDDSLESAASVNITVPISAPLSAVGDLAPGVYPLRGTLSSTDLSLDATASTVMIVSADNSRQITALVPITATPANGSLLTADELTELTAPDGALTAQLEGVTGTLAVLAIDPLVPAAIRALGTAAPASATVWLTRLESLSNERFALQPGDADATVQARAQLPELLQPLTLDTYLDPAHFAPATPTATPAPTPSASPSASPTPSAPELPTYEELTVVSSATSHILWPLGDVETADLSTFDAYLDADTTTVLPSSSLAAKASALMDIDGHQVLASDAAASASFSGAAATLDDDIRENEIAAGIAHLTYAPAGTPVLIGLDRDETRTAESLRETILSLSVIAQPATLSDLRANPASAGTISAESGDQRAVALSGLLADEDRLTQFASILDDPAMLLAPERLNILHLIGVGDAGNFQADVTTHRMATVATLDAVGVQQPSPIQLFTSAAPLPVWLRNDLPWPVNVTLDARPSDARLDVQPRTEVAALPASNTRVKVPVEARVGSGQLNVHFSLSSPTGVQIGKEQTASVTVRAEWESIGLIILAGIIGILLVLGIIRTVVRRRKTKKSDAADETTVTP